MAIETEYRGYSIRYSENNDTWDSYDAGVHDQPTLSKVKEKIDGLHLKMRKAAAVPCFEFRTEERGEAWSVRITEATVIDYLGPKIERSSFYSKQEKITDHKVASVAQRDGRAQKARQGTVLRQLFPDRPEVHAALAEANELGKEAGKAAQRFRAAVRAIPRLSLEDIAELVKASEARLEE